MTRIFEGDFDARDLRVAIIVARFNETIGRELLQGALDSFKRHGVPDEKISVAWVPGAFEIPVTAKRLALSREFDAIVCLGAVIRGETAHFDYVAGHASNSIGQVSVDTGVPIANGVLTTETVEQARDRAGGKHGNKGAEAALAAIEMANLLAALPKPIEGI
ncbi:MAG: 6,7-dimethyl-8-ribityllumazine synthase [Actinomycetota bacterium]|jgi:6,7-dimethyl-8-ribityllumazine synthase|nr:6,7-dimethyl-8-ribityllumazine synthase [Actinomycetota bacterium]